MTTVPRLTSTQLVSKLDRNSSTPSRKPRRQGRRTTIRSWGSRRTQPRKPSRLLIGKWHLSGIQIRIMRLPSRRHEPRRCSKKLMRLGPYSPILRSANSTTAARPWKTCRMEVECPAAAWAASPSATWVAAWAAWAVACPEAPAVWPLTLMRFLKCSSQKVVAWAVEPKGSAACQASELSPVAAPGEADLPAVTHSECDSIIFAN